jgi:hypothetical protein
MEKFLKVNRNGELIVPAGSARDFFLYIKPEALDEAQAFLAPGWLAGLRFEKSRSWCRRATSARLFPPSSGRVPGIWSSCPIAGESVWWFEKDKFEQKFRGHHGGLTKEELEIPLLTWEM